MLVIGLVTLLYRGCKKIFRCDKSESDQKVIILAEVFEEADNIYKKYAQRVNAKGEENIIFKGFINTMN